MFSLLWTLVVGFIVGVLAKLVHPGKEDMGMLTTTLLGIGGSVVATYGGQAIGIYKAGRGAGFIGATVGAVLILVAYGYIKKNR